MFQPQVPNRLFIKLMLSFWLCSSMIIAVVVLLPLVQQRFDRAPLPPQLIQLLRHTAEQLQQQASQQPADYLKHWQEKRYGKFYGKPSHLRLFLTDSEGRSLSSKRNSRQLRHFMLMAEEAGHPISHQFRHNLLFGPYYFNVNGENYALWGRLPAHHPRPWFLFLASNKWLTLGLATTLSGLICALLAWHLGKPLWQLKQSANNLAKGDLACRVDKRTTQRTDEIGQLAKAFNLMADAIQHTLDSQQRLISDISHELRTPLTRLQLALALARKKGDYKETAEIKRIAYEAEQLELLIGELLELSRLKKYQQHEFKSYELAETLSQVLDDAEFEAEQQGKILHIDLPENIVLTHHPRHLSRAIENLLRNAIRYAEAQICLAVISKAGNQVEIMIEDDGPGVPEIELERIFKPFYRPDTARERDSGGWGLGLAIAQAAITAHKGSIKASNRTPHGLKVEIRLPAVDRT